MGKSTFPAAAAAANLLGMAPRRLDAHMKESLRELRDMHGVDQTLQNLLRALTLNLELRARYRVFEFEAAQDGYPETARLFRDLRAAESEQITSLMSGLQARLNELDVGTAATP